ncbi:MAG TPA: DUF2953 domain-containing protein [Symbiobacteriaceae bacterium]
MAVLPVALVVAALLLWFLPVQVRVQLRQHNGQATLRTEVGVAWWKRRRELDLAASLQRAQALDLAVTAPHRTEGGHTGPPWKHLLTTLEPPVRYLLRRMRCRSLDLSVMVGGGDAMVSALLTGVTYAVMSTALGVVSRWMRLPRSGLRMRVTPSFQELVWRIRLDCILTFRLGDAIVAGIWSLYRVRREPVLAAWLKRRRSKGVEGSVGAPDSGADEDGDGKHQEHGGRQHRGR